MKNKLSVTLAIAVLLLSSPCIFAAGTNDPSVELKNLVTKVRADIRAGKTTETALADDIKQYDVLLAEHKGEKTDAVARILYMKMQLYSEVLTNTAKADKLMKQLKTDFKGACKLEGSATAKIKQHNGLIELSLKKGEEVRHFQVSTPTEIPHATGEPPSS